MLKRIIAMLMAITILLSFAACSSADDEEGASADTIVTNDNDKNQEKENEKETENQDSKEDNEQTEKEDDKEDEDENDDTATKEDDVSDVPSDESSEDPEYTVTFDLGYGDKTFTQKTKEKLEEPDVTREGYELEGWYDEGFLWNFDTDVVLGDITLTAKWKGSEYSIKYVADGATLSDKNPTTYIAGSGNIELEPPVKKGGVFVGWSIYDGKKTTSSTVIPNGTSGDLTVTALWDENALILGSYEQDGNTDSKEPIVWIKLKEENGKALYMSKYILDAQAYYPSRTKTSWTNSSLRNWLNNTFYNVAFSADDKKAIIYDNIVTPKNDQKNVGVEITTKDHVSLLSLQEAETLTTYAQRKAEVTAYAQSKGCVKSNTGTGDWWLRTVGGAEDYAALIQENSGIREGGYIVSMTTVGVRPIIWVDLSQIK